MWPDDHIVLYVFGLVSLGSLIAAAIFVWRSA